MIVALTCAAAVGLVASGRLLTVSWRTRSVLPLLCAFVGSAAAALAGASALAGHHAGGELALAVLALVIGTVLYEIGQRVWRLLEDEPEARPTEDESLWVGQRSNRTQANPTGAR